MKLVISKSRDGKGYYTKVQNDFNGVHTEKYLSLQIPRGTELEYGLYDVDGFLSTYQKKDGTVEFKLVVTDVTQVKQFKETEPSDPFKTFGDNIKTESEIGQQIEITDEDLPF